MKVHEQHYRSLQNLVNTRLHSLIKQKRPKQLTDGCRYVLSARGKRVRSTLVLLSCEAVGGRAREALNASVAIELLHNFTLVHDDIMDNASTRRKRATVHTRWDVNNALLVGDVLLGLAYKQILRTHSLKLHRILELLTAGFLEVCEGQAFDLEFEHRKTVTLGDYFEMIEKKTGRLISASAELGALIGGGTKPQIEAMRRFGHYLGRAFQLQDDLLDVIADEKKLGKQIGGDILEGKKTFLLLKSLKSAKGDDRRALMSVMSRKTAGPLNPSARTTGEVRRIASIYKSTGAIEAAKRQIRYDTGQATNALRLLPVGRPRETLHWFSDMLLSRSF